MSLLKRINPFLKAKTDTGFGTNADAQAGRFLNKDGSFNVVKKGGYISERIGLYNNMLNMPGWQFLGLIFSGFILINLFFSAIYFFMEPSQLTGIIASDNAKRFRELFFFSAQTLTTVGYGRINPVGDTASIVASFEALTGFLLLAIATGLFYGRFSKPRAYIKFSKNALIAPYNDKTALMFRFVSYKNNHTLTDVEVRVTLGITLQENGKAVFKFYELHLERNRIDSLIMNWTIVHPIDEQSPIAGFTQEDLAAGVAEIYVLVRGFDDIFSNTVLARSSYTYAEIIFNARFVPMYTESEDGTTTLLNINKLDEISRG